MAADPIGDWLVKDGYAHIRIDNCAGKMWGIVAWEKTPGAIDNENPDPTKKGRPVLGMPILLGMKPTKPNLWEGEIYNANNGKIYDAKISMVNDNTLKLEGCVGKQFFGDIFCGGENWTRVAPPPAPPAPAPNPGTKTKGPVATKGVVAPLPQSDVCARVAEHTGPPGAAPAKQVK
jgi:uncharacterized protein (DUF2147 family)